MANPKIWELHRTALAALMGASAALLFCVLHLAGALRPVENTAYDQRFRWLAHPELASKQVVIISLDNASFASKEMLESFGRWPWNRKIYAQLLWYLRRAPARAIGIDLTFAGRDEHKGGDEFFIGQLGQRPDTVLAFMLNENESEQTAPVPDELRRNAWKVANGACGPANEYPGLDIGLRELNQKARALGCIRVEPDSDGILRRAPMLWRYRGAYYPSFALALAAPTLLGSGQASRAEFRCGGAVRSGKVRIGNLQIPVAGANRDAMIYWYGAESDILSDPAAKPPASSPFRHYPVWAVVNSALALSQDQKPLIDPAVFRDKIVLIGPSAAGIGDIRPSPFSGTMPGVEVQATMISNLLQGHFVRRAGNPWALLAIVLMALGASLVVWFFADWRAYTAVTLGLAACFLAVNFALFQAARLSLVLVAPLAALAFSYAAGNITRYVTEGREKKRYRTTLMKYVAPQLVEAIMHNPHMAELHNEKLDLTVLFSDVRGFTSISEKIPVNELVATLNEFLNAMVEVIFANGGTLDKFVGDCVMAIWGAPVHQENHAELACRTALEMQAALARLNQDWRQQGRPELQIGVGINSGEMIFGNIGAEKRMDFTVIGDNVNLASRLESSTKELKASIVISHATYERVVEAAEVRDLGTIKVKGKDVPIRVYELLGMSGKEIKSYASTHSSG